MINVHKENIIAQLEDYVGEYPQVECKVEHKFCEGLYVRTLHIPKGTLIVGKRHRNKTLNMLTKGSITIYDGDSTITHNAPFTFEADKYSKKAGFAHEDSIWVNIHVTSEKDLVKLEAECIIPEEEYKSLAYNNEEVLT